MTVLTRTHHCLQWMHRNDLRLCLWFNRTVHRQRVQRFFALVSRLGDGAFWYGVMVLLPLLHGLAGGRAALQMLLIGLAGTAVYKLTKAVLVRERPFVVHTAIQLGATPLDRYSFPSGHTLHAVLFTAVAGFYFPLLLVVMVPFTLLVATSRMVLGLHYPSDVAMGALLGGAIAYGGLKLVTLL